MEPGQGSPKRDGGALRRYGPLLAIVVVVLVVAGVVVLANRNKSDDTTAATTSTAASGNRADGVVTWESATADGTVNSIDWGARCDTSRGTLKYPSFFAGQCYAPFTGDNGGATATGVTADSIKVVLYLSPKDDPVLDFITGAIKVDDTNEQTAATMQGFNEFYDYFNETYGRKVDIQIFEGTGTATDEVAARADAVTIAEQMKPFAVWNGPLLTPAFADELAARKVVCIACNPAQSFDFYIDRDPYIWNVSNNAQQSNTHVAEYIGKRLANQNAEWAGDQALKDTTRKFGLVYLTTGEESEKVERDFESKLDSSGVSLAERVSYASPVDLQTSAPQAIAKLKAAGVTSVIFVGDPVAPGPLTTAATSQDYEPEWILTGSALVDTSAFARTYDQEQWSHAFGVSTNAARVDPQTTGTKFLYQWFFGKPTPTVTGSPTLVPDLSLFYAVIQGVGPNLTAENFRNALFAAAPTPHALTQPSLSYGNKDIWPKTDYLGIDDATEIWWNPTAKGQDEIQRDGSGLYEFVNGGQRYLPGQWPTTKPNVFNPEGAVTIYPEPPPSEPVPTYPSPQVH